MCVFIYMLYVHGNMYVVESEHVQLKEKIYIQFLNRLHHLMIFKINVK